MASAQRTQDHESIKQWVEDRGGVPAIVKGTGGLLRIDFIEGEASGGHEDSLEEASWDDWFEIFDDNELTFLCSPEKESRFFKLVRSQGDESETSPSQPAG